MESVKMLYTVNVAIWVALFVAVVGFVVGYLIGHEQGRMGNSPLKNLIKGNELKLCLAVIIIEVIVLAELAFRKKNEGISSERCCQGGARRADDAQAGEGISSERCCQGGARRADDAQAGEGGT